MDLEELDSKIQTTYYLEENEVIKQIDDFLNNNYKIKVMIKKYRIIGNSVTN